MLKGKTLISSLYLWDNLSSFRFMDFTGYGGQVTETSAIAQLDSRQRLEQSLGLNLRAQAEPAAMLSSQVKMLLIVRGVDGVVREQLLKLVIGQGVIVDSQLRSHPYEHRGLSPADLQAEVLRSMLEHVEHLMNHEHPMIGVSDTFSQRCEVAPFLELAERMGYTVQILMCEAVTVVENGVNRLVECGESSDELRQVKENWEPFDPAIESGIITRGFANIARLMNTHRGDEA